MIGSAQYQRSILLFWITLVTPSMTAYTMKRVYEGRIADEEIFDVNIFRETLTVIQAISTVYITFCPFYSYKFACWDKVGFYFHMFAIHLIFLAIPLISVVHSAFYFE